MSENPLHFLSCAPCKKCRGRTRYVSTGNCVPCAKAAVRARRVYEAGITALTPIPAGTFDDIVCRANAQTIRELPDDGSDLL